MVQNDLQELKGLWSHWDDEMKQLLYCNYDDIPYLLDVKVDRYLFSAMAQFWNSAYSCFTFRKVDLAPTVEEYTALLRCPRFQVDKIYSRAVNTLTFVKRLMNITGMSEQWVEARVQQKGSGKCIPWKNLRDLILTHPDMKKRVDVFALSIYGLVIFPKALRHIDEAVADLFDRLGKGAIPIPAILAETFRSLSVCRRSGEGRFIGCAQLLLVWFHSHFWRVEKASYRPFFGDYSPLKEIVTISRTDDITEEKWMAILQNLQEEDIEWKALWMVSDEILYRCGSYNWVPLLGIWGAVGYAPLLVLRQYRSRQFIPMTQGLAQNGFSYGEKDSKKKSREIYNAWNQTCRIKRITVNPMEYLRVVPSEFEIIKQDFEKKTSELERKIEQLEEEKIYLKLDVDVQKSEAENLRKRKREVEEDLDSLKTDYNQMHKSMRNAGLGKTSEQWRQEIQEEKARADWWERKFHDTQAREASLSKIRNLKEKVEELDTKLQNCEDQIELLKANNEQLGEQLHRSQDQVRDRDYLMGEAIAQIREVADHLQTLVVQADVLGVKYELESDRGRELARLLRKVKALGVRARPYM
ncbi:hypothetical protein CXB51_009191 [Gossypium anomalum]|uniref:DUF7745 domain-containing protein n=1 Tax=Gossypium anomalum TaxID=47600 RepID=A0A8J6D716_9ROSI|nr:hypothetical protein CXB51_009191 [Gossypium anomalum]